MEKIILSTDSAHIDIAGASGKGKTYLAKRVIANHPHIEDVIVFSKNEHDWHNPKSNIEDLVNTWNLYTRINRKELVKECIIVFDDFNNNDTVNMWRDKTIRSIFTEGRKYGVYAILIHHSDKDTGNIAKDNCFYKILFPKGDAQELHAFTQSSTILDPNDVKEKYMECLRNIGSRSFLLLRGRVELLLVVGNTGLRLPESNIYKVKNPPIQPQSDNTNQTGNTDLAINTNVQNNGQVVNSTINMQNNSVHNHLMKTNNIQQTIEIKNIYHTEKINKLNMGLKIKEIVRRHFITNEERELLIDYLNNLNTSRGKINFSNYKKVAVLFCKSQWPNEEFKEPNDTTRDTFNMGRYIINGENSKVIDTAYSQIQPYIPEQKIKNIYDTVEDSMSNLFGRFLG